MSDARRDELATRLTTVHRHIQHAAADSGRDSGQVTLVVVTKTWPADDIRRLHDLGVRDFGENRSQEAEAKAVELADLHLTWHFVGQIQSNKAARIAKSAAMVHSVDSARVASRLNDGAHRYDRDVDCLVQINLDPAGAVAGRGGVPPELADEVASAVESAGRLRMAGVMGVAPLGADPATAYQRLAAVARRVNDRQPGPALISAGMSGDFEDAIRAGATHVRVGTLILGERPVNR